MYVCYKYLYIQDVLIRINNFFLHEFKFRFYNTSKFILLKLLFINIKQIQYLKRTINLS